MQSIPSCAPSPPWRRRSRLVVYGPDSHRHRRGLPCRHGCDVNRLELLTLQLQWQDAGTLRMNPKETEEKACAGPPEIIPRWPLRGRSAPPPCREYTGRGSIAPPPWLRRARGGAGPLAQRPALASRSLPVPFPGGSPALSRLLLRSGRSSSRRRARTPRLCRVLLELGIDHPCVPYTGLKSVTSSGRSSSRGRAPLAPEQCVLLKCR